MNFAKKINNFLIVKNFKFFHQEYQETKELANSDQNRLDEVNRCVKLISEDIASLERTLYNRELVAAQIKMKLEEVEKLNAQQEAEVFYFNTYGNITMQCMQFDT